MRKAKNVLSSMTYYRKYNLALFLFFSLALFSFSLMKLLIQSQEIKMNQLLERWKMTRASLPDLKATGFDPIMKADFQVQQHYQLLMYLVVAGIAILLSALTGTLLYKRRQDIKSLLSLGLKKKQIIFQLMIETLFPIIFSFLTVLLLFLFFQSPLRQSASTYNNQLFSQQLSSELTNENKAPLFKTEHAKKQEPIKNGVLLPFNEHSFYRLDNTNSNFTYYQLWLSISINFSYLLIISLIVTAITITLSVTFLERRIYF